MTGEHDRTINYFSIRDYVVEIFSYSLHFITAICLTATMNFVLCTRCVLKKLIIKCDFY